MGIAKQRNVSEKELKALHGPGSTFVSNRAPHL